MTAGASATPRIRVAVLDMQPITPAVGGGRLRLLGLYHALGPDFETTYVGSYDWPGEGVRELRLSESLVEIDVPLSHEHFRQDAKWREFAGGRIVIDTAFAILGRLSHDFLERARAAARRADIAVFSHPWLYPLLADDIDRTRQRLVYDAQNAEALLRHEILGGSPFGRELAKGVAMAEAFLCRDADLVIACSAEDVRFFADAYGIPAERVSLVPNGVFVERIVPRSAEPEPANAGDVHADDRASAVFIGSHYPPNVAAAQFIAHELAPALPNVSFILCGGAADASSLGTDLPCNVRLMGTVTDAEKLRLLQAADLAVNPMFSGSGTNIKMFDFMAAALPVVTTPVGARGICAASRGGIVVCEPNQMCAQIARLVENAPLRRELGAANRAWVAKDFAWETLSPSLGALLRDRCARVSSGARLAGAASAARRVDTSLGAARAPLVSPPTIAILSTFGIRCGIAEYTTYFAEALLDAGATVTIIGNRLEAHEQVGNGDPVRLAGSVERAWRYDQRTWTQSRVQPVDVVRVLELRGARHLNVQYHRGFFSETALLDVLRAATASGVAVSVSLHNSSDATPQFLRELATTPAIVLVHRRSEQERLRTLGVARAVCLPQGIRAAPPAAGGHVDIENGRDAAPVIGTFGFLRPHKGLVELIDALSILRPVFPRLRLVAQTAVYPSSDSTDYLATVRRRIEQQRVADAVALDASFLPIDDVVEQLARVDAVVLPYAASDEGSSAAAAAALAARRPLITTQAPIFEELAGIAYRAEDNSPPVLAAAIGTVLANRALRRHLAHRSAREAEARTWPQVARRFLECIGSDMREPQAPARGPDDRPAAMLRA